MVAVRNIPAILNRAVGTRDRILAATERLIVESGGHHEISVRDIAKHSSANAALVSYYFGGKECLLGEIYKSLSEQMVGDRMRRLGKLGTAASVGDILECWLVPWLNSDNEYRLTALRSMMTYLTTFHSQLYARLFAECYEPSNKEFVVALRRAAPHLSHATALWRLYALAGSAILAADPLMQNSMQALSGGACRAGDKAMHVRQLLAMATAGFEAEDVQIPTARPPGSRQSPSAG